MQNMLVCSHHTIRTKLLLMHETDETVEAGRQTFDFLPRQLLHATDVKAVRGASGTSSGVYCGSCPVLGDFLGSSCRLDF